MTSGLDSTTLISPFNPSFQAQDYWNTPTASILGTGFNWGSNYSSSFQNTLNSFDPNSLNTSSFNAFGLNTTPTPTASGGFWNQVLSNVNASGIGAALGGLAGNGLSSAFGFGPANTTFTPQAAAAVAGLAQGPPTAGLAVGPGIALTEANMALQREANARTARDDRLITNPAAYSDALSTLRNRQKIDAFNNYYSLKGNPSMGFTANVTPGGPMQLPNSLASQSRVG